MPRGFPLPSHRTHSTASPLAPCLYSHHLLPDSNSAVMGLHLHSCPLTICCLHCGQRNPPSAHSTVSISKSKSPIPLGERTTAISPSPGPPGTLGTPVVLSPRAFRMHWALLPSLDLAKSVPLACWATLPSPPLPPSLSRGPSLSLRVSFEV